MPRHSFRRRAPAVLSQVLDHNLDLYSVAAMAAGVTLLALGSSAEAKVVVTQKAISILPRELVSIDLNHDGLNDFQFSLNSYRGGCSIYSDLKLKALTGGAVVGAPISSTRVYASALVRGAKVGPSANFGAISSQAGIERTHRWQCSYGSHPRHFYGNWGGNEVNRYLGVKFQIHGSTHYGWIRLSIKFQDFDGMTATINAYAYDTVANQKISAGSTTASAIQANVESVRTPGRPSLGALALGTDGLVLWKRKEDSML